MFWGILMTVAKQYNITVENSPYFTAFATDENRIHTWMLEQLMEMIMIKAV